MNRYPRNEEDPGVKVLISPPVIKKYEPIDAKIKPIIFNILRFSRKKIREKIAIITGATKQSNKAGRDGPIISTAEYNIKRYKETPVKLAKTIRIQISFVNPLLISGLRVKFSISEFLLNFRQISINRNEKDAIVKRYNAIDNGGIYSTAICTITNENPQKITISNKET